jgi:hypothetical protein
MGIDLVSNQTFTDRHVKRAKPIKAQTHHANEAVQALCGSLTLMRSTEDDHGQQLLCLGNGQQQDLETLLAQPL